MLGSRWPGTTYNPARLDALSAKYRPVRAYRSVKKEKQASCKPKESQRTKEWKKKEGQSSDADRKKSTRQLAFLTNIRESKK
jgi:hypothetical protein